MKTHIAKLYKFTPEKFLEFFKEVYIPEEKTVKKCPNNHKNASGKFCKDCGSPLTDEVVKVTLPEETIIENGWIGLDENCYFAISDIYINNDVIEFFLSLEVIEDNFYTLKEINDVIENSKLEKDEYTDLLEKYCSSFEYGVIDFMY